MPTKTREKKTSGPGKDLGKTVYFCLGSILNDQISSESDLADLVERRLHPRTLDALKEAGLTEKSLYQLIIPRRTLEHRKERHGLLTEEESDRVVRLARVIALAKSIFGDDEKTWAWLNDADQFSGKNALAKASTSAGARQVEERLYQLYYGIFG